MRFTAPPHTTGVDLSIGPIPVIDGFIETPDEMPHSDLAGLVANGFTPAPSDPVPAPAARPVNKPADVTDAEIKP